MHLRIGTRRSPLAMAQTNHVMGLIREKFPDTEFTLCQIATIADRDRVSEFHQFGMVGVFAVEHEQQLVTREVDFVVHSLKDLPTTLHEGLAWPRCRRARTRAMRSAGRRWLRCRKAPEWAPARCGAAPRS
ncbi:Porphobilinogen deaminase [Bosea thiooxidans]